jgi:hypothetical protein
MPEHSVIIEKRPEPVGSPTVGEVEVVEKAFAKEGLFKEAAHEAVGYVPYVPENAEA